MYVPPLPRHVNTSSMPKMGDVLHISQAVHVSEGNAKRAARQISMEHPDLADHLQSIGGWCTQNGVMQCFRLVLEAAARGEKTAGIFGEHEHLNHAIGNFAFAEESLRLLLNKKAASPEYALVDLSRHMIVAPVDMDDKVTRLRIFMVQLQAAVEGNQKLRDAVMALCTLPASDKKLLRGMFYVMSRAGTMVAGKKDLASAKDDPEKVWKAARGYVFVVFGWMQAINMLMMLQLTLAKTRAGSSWATSGSVS